jgi:hypothetical protein
MTIKYRFMGFIFIFIEEYASSFVVVAAIISYSSLSIMIRKMELKHHF